MEESRVRCPLCAALVNSAELETHLRAEMGYAPLSCLLCRRRFLRSADAEAHFRGPFAAHPDSEMCILETCDGSKEAELVALLGAVRPADAPACGACRCCRAGTSREAGPDHGSLNGAPARHALSPATPTQRRPEPEPSSRAEEVSVFDAAIDAKPSVATSTPSEASFSAAFMAPGAAPIREPIRCSPFGHHEEEAEDVAHGHADDMEVKYAESSLDSSRLLGVEAAEGALSGTLNGTQVTRYTQAYCSACRRVVPKTNAKNHIACVHLKKTLRSCRLCPYTSVHFFPTQMKQHLRAKHSVALSRESCEDAAAAHLPQIKALLAQLISS